MINLHIQQEAPHNHTASLAFSWITKYWFQVIVTVFLFQIYSNQNVQLAVQPSANMALVSHKTTTKIKPLPEAHQELSLLPSVAKKRAAPAIKWKSSDFDNLSFVMSPTLVERKNVPDEIVQEKMDYCRKYVKRFAKTAIAEMEKFGIPASITLAQGLLESNVGDSRLARESNNHFGIKCRSKCRGCTCRNYPDDDAYDMFRVFGSVWESFREHSLLLQISRYQPIKKLGTSDYKGWAVGLKKAGYATDKNYHKKLVKIIEELDLHQFDK